MNNTDKMFLDTQEKIYALLEMVPENPEFLILKDQEYLSLTGQDPHQMPGRMVNVFMTPRGEIRIYSRYQRHVLEEAKRLSKTSCFRTMD